MSAWYEDTFGRDYLSLYPHRNAQEADRDIDGILRLISPDQDQPLLDLCCGAGRHLVALHHAGFTRLTGLDLSADLLAEARSCLSAGSINDVQLIQADMRNIPGDSVYQTILSLFTSFGYFPSEREDERVLRSAHRALKPGGIFLLDTLNRSRVISHLRPQDEQTLDGKQVAIRRRISPDGLRVEKETRISQPGSPDTLYRESVRMYERSELQVLLDRIGFTNVCSYGSLQGSPFCENSSRMVFTASKRAT